MSSIMGLVGQKVDKTVKFMNTNVKIFKLSVEQVLQIQEKAKTASESEESGGIEILKTIIAAGVDGGDKLSDADLRNFPLDELSALSAEIMKFSNIGAGQGK